MHTPSDTNPKVIIFRLPGEESAHNARSLLVTARAAGFETSLIGYWPDGHKVDIGETCLLEVDLSSAPRLSAWAFGARCGFDLDTLSLAAHNMATETLSADLLLSESVWHQRLRGLAHHIHETLRTRGLSNVIIPHGSEVISRIIATVAQQLGYPVAYWESGFLSGHLYLDHKAPHFFRGLCSADIEPSAPSSKAIGQQALTRWRAEKNSKYIQSGEDALAYRQWLDSSSLKTLFIAGQVRFDANVITSLGACDSLVDIYADVLDNLPDDWRVVFKPHPRDPDAFSPDTSLGPQRFFVGDIGIHEAISMADAVLVHTSNVGLEAVMLGKPVLVTGAPVYLRDTMVIQLDDASALPSALRQLKAPSEDETAQLLGHLLETVLLKIGDTHYFSREIEAASKTSLAPQSDLVRWYPNRTGQLIAAAHELETALSQGMTLPAAMASLPTGHRDRLSRYLDTELLTRRLYGGPEISPEAPPAGPVFDLGEGARAATIFARLENKTDPASALQALARDNRPVRFTVPLRQNQETSDIQSFDMDDLEMLLGRLSLPYASATANGVNYATVIIGHQPEQHGLARPYPWHLQAQWFHYAAGTQVAASGPVAVNPDAIHAHYGPFLEVPAGVWSIRHPGPLRRFFYRFLALTGGRPRAILKLEVVEHENGQANVIHETAWYDPAGRFTAREGCRYEFRSRLHKTKKNRQPRLRFDGLELVSETSYPLNGWISAP